MTADTSPVCELDSHADTCAFGKHCYIVNESSQQVSAKGFHPNLPEMSGVKIVTAAIAYDCPELFVTFVLIFPQSLHFPSMDRHLICPDQLRENGIVVNDIPLLRIPPAHRTPLHHSILDPSSNLHIPLQYDKPISYFQCRKPTFAEVNDNINNIHVYMTSELEWNPYDEQARRDELLHRRPGKPPKISHR